MEEFAIVSVDATVPQDGEDRTVRSLVGIVILILRFLSFIVYCSSVKCDVVKPKNMFVDCRFY